jgi:hypothetical protein
MASITVRNISDDLFDRIKTISELEKRSLNGEILVLLEKGVSYETGKSRNERISRDTQLAIWKRLSGEWQDKRNTKEIIDDIYSSRTAGREFDL